MSSESEATTPWASTCFGVDVAGDDVCMVRAERSGRGVNWTVVPFDRDVLAKATKSGAAVAYGLPVGVGLATWVRAPFASKAKALRVFPTLLDIQLPFPLEECGYCFSEAIAFTRASLSNSLPAAPRGPVGDAADSQTGSVSALALVARKADMERQLSVLADMGIDPHVLDYEGVALWTQALRERPVSTEANAPLRVVMFMRREGGVMVIGRGNAFWSAHRIKVSDPLSVGRFLRAQMNPSESSLSVEWVWAGIGLDTGGSGAKLRMEVEQRWPGDSITLDSPESLLARALVTRALLRGPLRGNLRTGTMAHVGAQSRTQGIRIQSAAVLMVAGLLLCGAAAGWKYRVAAQRRLLDAQFTSRLNTMMGYSVKEKGSHAFLVAERELADRRVRREPLARALRPSLLADLHRVLPEINKRDAQVTHLTLTAEGVQLKGSSGLESVGEKLREAMISLGYVVDATVDPVDKDNRFTFMLNATHGGQHE